MLIGSLELDGAPAKKSLHELNEKFEQMLGGFSKFGKFAAGGFIAEGIMHVMHGFEGVIEKAAQLQSMHLATGDSVHDLFIFQKALERAGGSADVAQGFIFKLQNALACTNEDNQKTAESFELMRISMQEIKGAT